ncbi:MAG: hypothetical protein ACLUIQ_02610 [Dialister invisus]
MAEMKGLNGVCGTFSLTTNDPVVIWFCWKWKTVCFWRSGTIIMKIVSCG